MTKVRKWRLILALMLAACLAAGLAFALQPQHTSANAEDVLDGNTATYTINNDVSRPWDYDRATNTWTNTRNSTSATKLTIAVTQSGNVVLEYKMNGVDNNTPGGSRYAFNLSDLYVTLKQGTITNTIVAEHGIAMPDFERLELDNLSTGDEIVFSYKRAASNGEEDNLYIRGLTKPQVQPLEVKLTAAEGGNISFEQEQSASITKSIEFGSPVAFEAIPDGTHVFAYWSDKTGNVLSYDPKISIALLSAIDYTANFYQKDGETKVTLGTGWEHVTKSPDVPTSYEGYKTTRAALGQQAKLVFEAVGDHYLTLKYAFLLNYDAANYASNKITGYYNGDDYVNISGGSILSLNRSSSGQSASADNLTWNDDFYFHLAGEGYHRLELEFNGTGYVEANDIFAVKDIVWDEAPETVTFQLEYDNTLGTVYMDDVAVQPGQHSVIKGQYVCFSASFNDVMSKIDPDQKASVCFEGFFTKEGTQIWPDTQSCYIKFSDSMLKSSRAESSTLYIKANFEEIAVLPEVSVSVTSGSDFQEAVAVKSGDTVVLPYGQENSVSFMFDDFASITEKFTVSLDGEVQSEVKIVEEAGKNFFRLEGIDSNKTVTVQYQADGYFESPIFTLYLVVTNEDDISEHLFVEGAKNIEVENDPYVPWVFSAAYTTDTGFAYMAGNSGALGYYGKAVSSLKFKVTGAGLLDFDFKLQGGGNFWLVWGEQPLSITDTINQAYGGTHASETDSNGEKFWRINSDDNTDVGRLIAAGCTFTKTVSNNNYMFWLVGGEKWEGKKTTTMLEDGWAHVSIPMGEDGQQKTYYVSYYVSTDTYLYATPWSSTPACFAAIRNVGFFSGEGTLNYSISNNEAGSVSATSGGKEAKSGSSIALGSRVTFKATVSEGEYQFYGWVNPDGKLLSTAEEYTTSVTDKNFTVKAIIESKGKYSIRNDGKFYEDLASAISAAEANDKLIVIKDGVTVSTSMELPAGVSLVLPVNDRGDDYELGTTTNSTARVPWSSDGLIGQYKNFTLTVAEGQTFTIKGSLFIGAVEHYPNQNAQGATSGKYNVLNIQGSVVVDEGGHLDVRGLVTGTGGITAKKGGKLTQPFMILDYNGGTNTEASFNAGVTPFKMYAMVNIQCEKGYTIEYGGELWGHASLYFWSSTTTIDTPFITWEGAKGDSENALLILKNGAKVTSVYDDGHTRITGIDNVADVGKTTMTVEGGAKAGYMQFPLGINTAGVYFSLPYNYELVLKKIDGGADCTYDLENNFKLMPGSVVRVEEGTTLNIVSGKGLQVYDSFFIPPVAKRTYPTAAELEAAGYKPYASLIVNGTLNIQSGATFLGTVQTTNQSGTAKIIVGADVTLEEALFDGVATQYSCNYTSYTLKAQVWDKVHQKLCKLEAGHTYTSAYAEGDTFTLADIKFSYCAGGVHSSSEHTAEKLKEQTVSGAADIPGAWKLQHEEHVYDWTQQDADAQAFDGNSKQISRRCTEVGCDVEEHKTLLKYVEAFEAETYKGEKFTEAELFEKLYTDLTAEDLGVTFTVEGGDLKAAGNYSITARIPEGKGYFLSAENKFADSATFTFEIKQKAVTLDVKDQAWAEYNGQTQEAHKAEGTDYVLTGVCKDDHIDFSLVIDSALNAGSHALTVQLGTNPNYIVTPTYTSEDHSVFTIAKATLRVTISGQSSKGDDLAYRISVVGYQNGEENLLDENGNWQAHFTITPNNFDKDSAPESYTFSVAYIGDDLANYKVECEETGTYVITESVYKGVTFSKESVVYDGETHTFAVKGADGCTVTYFYEESDRGDQPLSKRDVGSWMVRATITKDDHAPLVMEAIFEITVRTVTVEILAQGKTYDGTPASVTGEYGDGKGWKLAEGSSMGTGDEVASLNISLTVEQQKNVGSYDISGTSDAGNNYKVEFTSGQKKYTISPKEITATVTSVTTVYGEEIAASKSGVTYAVGALVGEDTIPVVIDLSQVRRQKGSYPIGATVSQATQEGSDYLYGNYKIHIANGTWEVTPKPITVIVSPVEVTYSGSEPAAPTAWSLKSDSTLAYDDEEADLNVRLAKAAGTDADSYDITASYENENYTVTFEGLHASYVIAKLDVSGTADFFIMEQDGESAQGDVLRVAFKGSEIKLAGYVSLIVGEEPVELKCTLTQDTISEIGEFTITLEVNETNYRGSKTFRVIVTNEAGYTEGLIEALGQLRPLAEGLTPETLTAADYAAVKEIKGILDSLSEEDTSSEEAQAAIAPYEQLVDAWNRATNADIDDVIETADSIADALVNGLFGAAATVSVLAALAFVAGKGGLL